uniref:Uncharacterized protein n=1 Tax=Ciona intestinalis TaxID=7719 RepID=H2XZ85_CIOIN
MCMANFGYKEHPCGAGKAINALPFKIAKKFWEKPISFPIKNCKTNLYTRLNIV